MNASTQHLQFACWHCERTLPREFLVVCAGSVPYAMVFLLCSPRCQISLVNDLEADGVEARALRPTMISRVPRFAPERGGSIPLMMQDNWKAKPSRAPTELTGVEGLIEHGLIPAMPSDRCASTIPASTSSSEEDATQ